MYKEVREKVPYHGKGPAKTWRENDENENHERNGARIKALPSWTYLP
jgi:hypothetical protein